MLVEMIAERKRFFAAQSAAEQRTYKQVNSFVPMDSEVVKDSGKKDDSSSKQARSKKKRVNSFVPMDSEVVKDSGKNDDSSSKQARSKKKRVGSKLKTKSPKKLNVIKEQVSAVDEQEKEVLGLCLKIVQDEDITIIYETVAVKSPIIDWESQLLGSDLQEEDLSYWKITRADGSSRFYKVFSTMLEEFNRQDLFDLHRLVMKKFESVTPEGYDLIL
nr:hypothetical protein [Tanacetum cinerariifolium]